MHLWHFSDPNMVSSTLSRSFEAPGMGMKAAWRVFSGIAWLGIQVSALSAALSRPLCRAVVSWHVRRKTMRSLMALDNRALKDIGLDRGEIAGLSQSYATNYAMGEKSFLDPR